MLELLLKCLKNLSLEPSTLNDLERAGTLETIVPLLAGPLRERYIVHILPCLFNLCRINKRRQEVAASLGIVPHLKRVIAEGSHLRQFALPILFDLAHTSTLTRCMVSPPPPPAPPPPATTTTTTTMMSSDPENVSRLLVQPACLSKLIGN
eukprot:scaffold4338_cov183-Ochromonas_danica.AAC.14